MPKQTLSRLSLVARFALRLSTLWPLVPGDRAQIINREELCFHMKVAVLTPARKQCRRARERHRCVFKTSAIL
jgi:hypothetical protein